MQAVEQCMEDGDATVCTCKTDLCNSSPPLSLRMTNYLFGALLCSITSLIVLKNATQLCCSM